jgi:hypothetical protein
VIDDDDGLTYFNDVDSASLEREYHLLFTDPKTRLGFAKGKL